MIPIDHSARPFAIRLEDNTHVIELFTYYLECKMSKSVVPVGTESELQSLILLLAPTKSYV
jgi:hypothetical protein